MRTHAFVQVVAAGIIASTYGLEINKTDPAALEMCPATDGFAQADAQILGRGWGFTENKYTTPTQQQRWNEY